MAHAAEQELVTYLEVLNNRLARVEKLIFTTAGAQHETAVEVERQNGALHQELLELENEATRIDDELVRLVHHTQRLVSLFQDVARREDLRALDARVKHWDGESYVTRREFLRWLAEAFRA